MRASERGLKVFFGVKQIIEVPYWDFDSHVNWKVREKGEQAKKSQNTEWPYFRPSLTRQYRNEPKSIKKLSKLRNRKKTSFSYKEFTVLQNVFFSRVMEEVRWFARTEATTS